MHEVPLQAQVSSDSVQGEYLPPSFFWTAGKYTRLFFTVLIVSTY